MTSSALLACGPIPPNPADLLSSGRFRAIIKEASAQFDVVIVDAPPVLGLADAPLIASVVNDVLLVIESGKTRTAAALEAMNRLRAAGANMLGGALTKSIEESSAYGTTSTNMARSTRTGARSSCLRISRRLTEAYSPFAA